VGSYGDCMYVVYIFDMSRGYFEMGGGLEVNISCLNM